MMFIAFFEFTRETLHNFTRTLKCILFTWFLRCSDFSLAFKLASIDAYYVSFATGCPTELPQSLQESSKVHGFFNRSVRETEPHTIRGLLEVRKCL
jgi:hypothetical protein